MFPQLILIEWLEFFKRVADPLVLTRRYLHVDPDAERVPEDCRGRALQLVSSAEEQDDDERAEQQQHDCRQHSYQHLGVVLLQPVLLRCNCRRTIPES